MSWENILKMSPAPEVVYDLIEKEGYVFKETKKGWNHLDIFMKGDSKMVLGDIKTYGINGAWFDKQSGRIRYMSLDGINTMLQANDDKEAIVSIWNQMKTHGSPTNGRNNGNTIYDFDGNYHVLVNETDEYPDLKE